MKAKALLAILLRPPLNYTVHRQKGSHRVLRAEGRGSLIFAFHDGQTIPAGLVRKILLKDAGVTPDELDDIL